MKSILLTMVFPFFLTSLFSQFFEYGQEPSSIKWKRFDTENFRLIFPAGYEENAPKILWLLEHSYKLNAKELKHKPRKIPVLLHNQTAISNGFVALAPTRMELFLHPDPNGYAGDRLRQLTLHEMRHVVQTDKLNQGFTRFLSTLTGEQGLGIAAAMLPFWFLEGDAIMAETANTQTGRGRLPSFEKEIKAILADEKKPYSYDKSYFGSYKNFIPSYYHYGYQMVAHAHNKYGEEFWPEAIKYAGRRSWLLFPLHFYIRRETGLNITGLYSESMDFIKDHWQIKAEARNIHKYEWITKEQKVYTSYTYPHILNDSSVIAVKTGLDIIPSFVRIRPDGTEKKLFSPGYLHSGRISIKNSRILWDEYISDPRWGNRSFSVLKLFNYETGLTQTLTKNTRYSSPAFSSSGDTIVTIEINPQQQTSMVLLSPENGHYYSKVLSPDNAWLQYPEWIEGTSLIAAIASDDKGKKIVFYNRDSETWQTAFYSGFHDIKNLESHGKHLFFQSSFSGIDDIYALNVKNGELFRITYSRYGAFYPGISPDGNEISFSGYTINGYRPARIDLKDPLMVKVEMESFHSLEQPFFNTQMLPEDDAAVISIPDDFKPVIKNYSKAANLFRFHSWLPFYFDYNNTSLENPEINPGISITSQNTLSTALTSLGYEYNDNNHFFHTSFTYKGFLPVLSFSSRYGGTPIVNRLNDNPVPSKIGKNQSYNFITYIPLSFNTGKFIHGIQPILKINYSGSYFYYQSEGTYKGGMTYTEPRLYLYSFLRRTYRDLQPKFGYILDARSLSSPFEKEQQGSISALKALIYLPGLAKNHGLKLQAQFQTQNTERYLYNNLINFPRGYESLASIGIKKYSADYILPLVYPDLRIGSLIYLKRIHANLFMDYMFGKDVYEVVNNTRSVSDKTLRSLGAEIYFEYHFLRILFPFIQGVRISYLPEQKNYKIEGVFTVDIRSFQSFLK